MPQYSYLKKERLADVIAAIQALGAYKYYKLDFDEWADRITGDKAKSDYWKDVFKEHPEFFRISTRQDQVSLVWRRQLPKNFLVNANDINSSAASGSLPIYGRRPLDPGEITALIGIAVNLHERALEQDKARKWLVPLIIPFIGALLGAAIAAYATIQSKSGALTYPQKASGSCELHCS